MTLAWLAFLATAAVVICAPGPDTFRTVGNALSSGRSAGAATAVGVALGQLVWTFAASAGLAALVVASGTAFQVLSLLGAALLIYLGLRTVYAAVRGDTPRPVTARTTPLPGRAFRQGLISNLMNPKMVAFFTGLLPQFGGGHFWGMAGLGLVFCLLTCVWLLGVAAVAARFQPFLVRRGVARCLGAVAGLVLTGFGLTLISTRPRMA